MNAVATLKVDACRAWVGFRVVDGSCEPVGMLRSLWAEPRSGRLQFLGVGTAWTAGRDLLVPAEGIEVDAGRCWIRLPYGRARLHAAPAYAPSAELTPERKGEIYLHYDTDGTLCPQISTLSRPERTGS